MSILTEMSDGKQQIIIDLNSMQIKSMQAKNQRKLEHKIQTYLIENHRINDTITVQNPTILNKYIFIFLFFLNTSNNLARKYYE